MGVLVVGMGFDQDCRAAVQIDLGISVRVPRAGERIFRFAARWQEVGWADP